MGEDIQQGELVLKQGNYLNPQNVGLLAAIGKTEIKVFSKYSIGIIATGSELVEPWDKPERTKIRNSNAWQLMGQIHNLGHIPIYYGIVQDDSMLIRAKTEEALNKCDILFLTGGASVGEFDLVASVLESLEFSIEFDRLAIQPGKPVTFALKDKKVCFGFSGNPVSCFLQFELLAKPFLLKSSGAHYQPSRIKSKLDREFSRKKTDRQYFLPVLLSKNGYVTPVVYHGSAHLHALNEIIGFAEIPQGIKTINKGEEIYVRLV
jgi:molybdopterin molybdotransferase